MALRFEIATDLLEPVELAVHYDLNRVVLIRDWLRTRIQIDDAQARVREPDTRIAGQPMTLTVRAAMTKRAHRG